MSIPKSIFFLASILDHFLITFGRQNDIQIDQKVTMLELRTLTFRDSFADPVPKRSRIDLGGRKVTFLRSKSEPLGSKSDPLDSKSDPLGAKSDPVASKSEPLLCKSYLQLSETTLLTFGN